MRNMTVSCHDALHECTVSSVRNERVNSPTALSLKRYLNLTLRGTKKDIAESRSCIKVDTGSNKGESNHPPSPYTFDRLEIEKSIQAATRNSDYIEKKACPPNWVNSLNAVMVSDNGEAPIFKEKLLSSHKTQQIATGTSKYSCFRPLSGISTKSAPVVINGAMYYRLQKKHAYLQASTRPFSAMDSRITRSVKLRNKHRSQLMSGTPSDGTKEELQRMKAVKPLNKKLNTDLLPIPCHTNETTRSFLIGARYNCSNFMDSRSFSCLGLYLPRKNPFGSFLKANKKRTVDDGRIDFGGIGDPSSVQMGDSTNSMSSSQFCSKEFDVSRRTPIFHRRKLVRESSLIRNEKNDVMTTKEHTPNIVMYKEMYMRSPMSYRKSTDVALRSQVSLSAPVADME